jgi:hypothetical protein
MCALPALLLRLPPRRRRVARGKFAICGAGTPASDILAERGRPLVCSLGAGTTTSDAPAGRGHPEVTVWWILGDLKWRVIQVAVHLRASDAGEEIPPHGEMMFPSLADAFKKKNPLNLKTPAGTVFSPGHPSSRRRETYRPNIHM